MPNFRPRCRTGAFGPRLQAAAVTLAVRNRVSRRDTGELVRELFGCELSTGSVDAIVQRAGEALAEPYADLNANVDERVCRYFRCAREDSNLRPAD